MYLSTGLSYFRTMLTVSSLSIVTGISCLIIPKHCWQLAYASFVTFLTYFICLIMRWLMLCCHWRLKMVTLSFFFSFPNCFYWCLLSYLVYLLTLFTSWWWLICCCHWGLRMIAPSFFFISASKYAQKHHIKKQK